MPKRWTEEENNRLNEALMIYERGDWVSISEYVGTRTRKQCLFRFRTLLRPTRGTRTTPGQGQEQQEHGKWSLDEGRRFDLAYALYGNNWRMVAKAVGTRDRRQCRVRMINQNKRKDPTAGFRVPRIRA